MIVSISSMTNNITPHHFQVSRQQKEERNSHKGAVLWFTGLSGSGKSTIANALQAKLFETGRQVIVLDGDNLRTGLNQDLGFSEADRRENIRRTAEVSKLFAKNAMITICSLISPLNSQREMAKDIVQENFFEVFVNCPITICRERDPKGLYKKADAGEIKNFTGVDSQYEAPQNPDITIFTDKNEISDSIQTLLDFLTEKKVLLN